MYKLNRQQIISIVLLFALLLNLFLGKKEKFTETERKSALDGLKIQNKLFNDVFSKVSNDDVNVNKKIIATKGIVSDGNIETKNDIKNGKITISADGTIYTEKLNVKSIVNNPKCRDVYGSYQEAVGKPLHYLDRQKISCYPHEFINGFNWERSGNNLRTKARCCSYK